MRPRRSLALLALVAVACGSAGNPTITVAEEGGPTVAEGDGTTSTETPASTSTAGPGSTVASSTTASSAAASCVVTVAGQGPYQLTDATGSIGLLEPLVGLHGHAAAFGDVDGDGFPDLFVGTFADRPDRAYAFRGADGPNPDRLLSGVGGTFVLDTGFAPALGRTSGAAFADLDGDGDLDLVASRNAGDGEGARGEPTAVFRNDGGVLNLVESGFGPDLGGRSIAVLDYDLDGLTDLFITEDRYRGGSSRLFRNVGDLRFEDVTAAAGIPLDVNGLGVAVGDLNGDARPDLFVAGSNRLLLSTGNGFTEGASSVFQWEVFGDEDILTGVDMADVNLDGRLDLVVGHHYNSTVDFDTEVSVRLYLNRGGAGADVTFEDVTEAAGLTPIPTKAPHVEFADMNNDGLLDIVTSASASAGTMPAIFLGTSTDPTFTAPDGMGSDQYWVTSPTADVNRDGRLDILAVEWEPSLPSLFFAGQNDGNWISVGLAELAMAPGATVSVYEAGRLGDPEALLARRPLTASKGYTAGSELTVHVGLGDRASVDVVVTLADGSVVEQAALAANAYYRLPGEC